MFGYFKKIGGIGIRLGFKKIGVIGGWPPEGRLGLPNFSFIHPGRLV